MKKLVRSRNYRLVAGVAAGMGQYFGIDVALTRIIWALFMIFTGFFPGVFAYLVCWAVMPEGD